MNRRRFLGLGAAAAGGAGWLGCAAGGRRLLNCSYDATRELYRDLNRRFAADRAARSRDPVRVTPSHGGSGSQARAVADGLPADVVTLATWPDTDQLRKNGLIAAGWEGRLPFRSCPYTSTIAFAVRRGNPFAVTDWADLARRPVRVVAANPKTSGAAKLGAIACWGAAATAGGSAADAADLVRAVYRKVPALESSSRAASVSFSRKQIGDVQLTWENEAHLEARESRGAIEVVYPPRSVLAEPHVAVVDAVAEQHGTAELAGEYLDFLYTPAAQAAIAGHFFRPSVPRPDAAAVAGVGAAAAGGWAGRFGRLVRFTVDDAMQADGNGWAVAQERLFADGALFDRLY